MFGILDKAVDYVFGEEQGEDARHHSQIMASQAYLENQKDRDWQERMANTRYQRGAQDLREAGFNPMLTFMSSAAPQPGGHGGVAGSAPIASSGRSNITGAMQSAAQIRLIDAETDLKKAEADQIRTGTHPESQARTREITARIPTHAQAVKESEQRIGESAVRIEKLWEETKLATSSAANVEQQTRNLKETVDQIRSQVQHLNALADKESAASAEIKQRIQANLPQMQRILGNLEKLQREMAQPGHAADERARDSFVGQVGAYLRALNPLNSFINQIPR